MGTVAYRMCYKRLVAKRWRAEPKKDGPLSKLLSRISGRGNSSVRLRIMQNFMNTYDDGSTVIQDECYTLRTPRPLYGKPAAGGVRAVMPKLGKQIKSPPLEVKLVKIPPLEVFACSRPTSSVCAEGWQKEKVRACRSEPRFSFLRNLRL